MSEKESWMEYLTDEIDETNDVINQKTLKGVVVGSDHFIGALEQKTGIILKEKRRGRPEKNFKAVRCGDRLTSSKRAATR